MNTEKLKRGKNWYLSSNYSSFLNQNILRKCHHWDISPVNVLLVLLLIKFECMVSLFNMYLLIEQLYLQTFSWHYAISKILKAQYFIDFLHRCWSVLKSLLVILTTFQNMKSFLKAFIFIVSTNLKNCWISIWKLLQRSPQLLA